MGGWVAAGCLSVTRRLTLPHPTTTPAPAAEVPIVATRCKFCCCTVVPTAKLPSKVMRAHGMKEEEEEEEPESGGDDEGGEEGGERFYEAQDRSVGGSRPTPAAEAV